MEKDIKAAPSFHYGWLILVFCVLIVMGALGFARFGYTMILPEMKKSLNLTDSMAGDLASGNLIGYLCMAILCGVLVVRFKPRKVIVISLFFISLAMALTGAAADFNTALIGRILAGIGSAGANISAMSLIMAWFSSEKRGFATGITVNGSSFGLVFTGLLIPYIMSRFHEGGWKYSWYVLAAVVFLIAVFSAFILKNRPEELRLSEIGVDNETFEKEKSGVNSAKNDNESSIRKVFASPKVWYLSLIYFMFGYSYITFSTFYARYLTWEAGMTVRDAGNFWSLIGVFSIASGLIWGSVSDKIGRKSALSIVFVIQGVCYLIFALWKAPAGYFTSSVLFALTAWSIPAVMAAVTGDLMGPILASMALGFVTFFFGIGQALAPFIAGRIADGQQSYTLAFILAGGAALLGGFLSIFIKK